MKGENGLSACMYGCVAVCHCVCPIQTAVLTVTLSRWRLGSRPGVRLSGRRSLHPVDAVSSQLALLSFSSRAWLFCVASSVATRAAGWWVHNRTHGVVVCFAGLPPCIGTTFHARPRRCFAFDCTRSVHFGHAVAGSAPVTNDFAVGVSGVALGGGSLSSSLPVTLSAVRRRLSITGCVGGPRNLPIRG